MADCLLVAVASPDIQLDQTQRLLPCLTCQRQDVGRRGDDFFLFIFCFHSNSAVQQSVVVVPALPALDGALRRELALPSPVFLQTTDADVHKDVLGLPQSFVEGKTLELGAACEIVLATTLVHYTFHCSAVHQLAVAPWC